MMGSLRNPAEWNGLYSLRPTAGWMEEEDGGASTKSRDEDGELVGLPYPISTPGPMARCPEDVAMMLQTMLPGGKSKRMHHSSIIKTTRTWANYSKH